MASFECTCRKVFTTHHKLSAHRAHSARCKQQWDNYVANFSLTPSAPASQQVLADDVIMEDVADNEPEEGIMDAPVMAPASADELSGDESETEEPENIPEGEDGSLSDTSSPDETYRYTSVADSDHNDSCDDSSDDNEFEPADYQASPSTTPQQPGQRRLAQGTPQRTEPLEPHVEAYPHAGFAREQIVQEGFRKSAQTQSTLGAGNVYYPFANEMDFELGSWLHESGLPKAKIDEFLKLKYVRDSLLLLLRLTPPPRFKTGSLHLHMHRSCMSGSSSCLMVGLGGGCRGLSQSMGTQLDPSHSITGM